MGRRLSSFSPGVSRGGTGEWWGEWLLCFVFLFIAFHFVCPLERSGSPGAGDNPGRTTHTPSEPWSLESEMCLGEVAISQKSENAETRRRRSVPAWRISSSRSFPRSSTWRPYLG